MALRDTFAGIAPAHVLPFVIAQVAGALAGLALTRWLVREEPVLGRFSKKRLTSPIERV